MDIRVRTGNCHSILEAPSLGVEVVAIAERAIEKD
jgi:hypothetical protein